MAQTFNPYAEWLGVSSAAARPNHYELLRLLPFESNPDAILTAANLQMAKVRGVRPGPYVDQWSRLLDELSAAKRCLSDFAEKSQYDAALRQQGWPASIASSAAESSTAANSSATPTEVPHGGPAAGAKRSPYMEFTSGSTLDPLPPQIRGGKIAGSALPAGNAVGGSTVGGIAVGGGSNGGDTIGGNAADAVRLQPGTNLLPPSPRISSDPAATNRAGGVTSPEASAQSHTGSLAKAWIPAPATEKAWTPPSPRAAQITAAPVAPAGQTAPASPPAPGSQPTSPGATAKLVFPGETVPIAPAQGPATSASLPPTLLSPPTDFPAPLPTIPAGMPQPVGTCPPFPRPCPQVPLPSTIPQSAAPSNLLPQQPVPPAAQSPFTGQFYPGGAMRAGVNPAFPQFVPLAPLPLAGGVSGLYPQPQAAAPGSTAAGPTAPQGTAAQGTAAQTAAPQNAAPQTMAPRHPLPASGGTFLDDVLNGPRRGGSSPMDGVFGDSAMATQAATPRRSRSQGSRTILIGGALGVVVLLAAGLVVVVVLNQRGPTVAVSDSADNGSNEPSSAQPGPSATKTTGAPKKSGEDAPSSKNPGPAVPANASASIPPVAPAPKNPADAKPPAVTPPGLTALVLQPTRPATSAPSPAKPPAVDPVKAARLNRLLTDARHKLAERDLADANRLMADAKTLAVTPEQTDRVQRMSTLVRYVGEFWGAVNDAMKGLKPTDEIEIGTDRAVVVEKDEQSITIRMAGGNHHISIGEMPGGFAVALANRWLDPNKPENKVFIGAFYAVDLKKSDRLDDAKRLWTEAAAAGVSDGTYLLPLLNNEPTDGDMAGVEMDSLPPVPDSKAIDHAEQKVRQEFDDDMVAATTPAKQAELIRRLLDAADSSGDNPVRQYVLCVAARDMAAKAGQPKQMIDAIDRIAREFRIDALDMKADTFTNFPPTTAAGGREITRAALALVDEAVGAKRMALASRLAQVAVAAAQVSKGSDLIKRATQRSKEIEALAKKKMAADPR